MQYIIQYPNSKLLSKNRSIIQYTKHYPLPNYPASKVLSIIQSNIHYPPHCPLIQALFEYPILPSKTGALSSLPNIIHYPTIQHTRYYPSNFQTLFTALSTTQNNIQYLKPKSGALSSIQSNIQYQ